MFLAFLALTVALISATAAPTGQAHAAAAPPACGQSPDGGPTNQPAAKLALDGQAPELVTDRAFGRKTGERELTLIYTVTGCEMGDHLPAPEDPPAIFEPKTGDAIPDGALKLHSAPSVEESRYVVRFTVSSDSIKPGSYAGYVELKAPWLKPVRTPVTISRSENSRWWPLLCGALGALAGFLLFALAHAFKRDPLLAGHSQFALAGCVSVAAGALAALVTNYGNQDIWVLGDNWWGAAGVGFAAATSGAMAVLLTPLYTTDTAANTKK